MISRREFLAKSTLACAAVGLGCGVVSADGPLVPPVEDAPRRSEAPSPVLVEVLDGSGRSELKFLARRFRVLISQSYQCVDALGYLSSHCHTVSFSSDGFPTFQDFEVCLRDLSWESQGSLVTPGRMTTSWELQLANDAVSYASLSSSTLWDVARMSGNQLVIRAVDGSPILDLESVIAQSFQSEFATGTTAITGFGSRLVRYRGEPAPAVRLLDEVDSGVSDDDTYDYDYDTYDYDPDWVAD